MMRPTYLEARRLQERIIAEMGPDAYDQIDSVVENEIEKQDTEIDRGTE